ncbi:hypothetical protein BBP40_003617 [Aspergillus hancockii]|nr:hypothetical protein BBP40_003617 [Aspergillus hancockii]
MKLAISLGVFALFASSAMAAYCTDHTYYCGWNLLEKGDYQREINEALRGAGTDTPTDHHVKESLFYCRDDAVNGVGFERTCNKCNNGGSGSDYCDDVGP